MFNSCAGRNGYSVIEDDVEQTVAEDGISFVGYKTTCFKRVTFHFVAVFLGGIPYLLNHWYPQLKAYIMYERCRLSEAQIVLLKDMQNLYTIAQVYTETIKLPSDSLLFIHRFFKYHMLKYIWNEETETFQQLRGLDDGRAQLNELSERTQGYTHAEQCDLLNYFGPNTIIVEMKSCLNLLVDEVLNPFYIFQIWSIILWSVDDYYYYAACIMFLCIISLSTSLYQTRSQSLAIQDLVAASLTHTVTVLRRSGDEETINASELVPGDIISIPVNGCVMACDALLLSGTCIVNESMLTGESMPITKIPPVPSEAVLDVNVHRRHMLFCGTRVIQTRFYNNEVVRALVVRTGFLTTKGELVRSILFPKPVTFKFYADSLKFVMLLFCTAIAGMSFSIYLFESRHADVETVVLRTLDIVTIVVPPALPAAMSTGTVTAQRRLARKRIFCTSPARINVCGKVKMVAFDKTGTLTEDGLDFVSVIPAREGQFCADVEDAMQLPSRSPIVAAMATCHSLTSIDGELTGDPLDLSMFEATHWILEEPGPDTTRFDMLAPTVVRPPGEVTLSSRDLDTLTSSRDLTQMPYEVGIVRQFPFTSAEQYMSVVTRVLTADCMVLYCKGAPEKVIAMCTHPTVPHDFSAVLNKYTTAGLRVLAFACRILDSSYSWRFVQQVRRDVLEGELTFLGLLLMRNSLKPEAAPVVNSLQDAGLRCVMVTGDNKLTAVSVARECGMIQANEIAVSLRVVGDSNSSPAIEYEVLGSCLQDDRNSSSAVAVPQPWHYVLDGATLAMLTEHFPQLLPRVLTKAAVFSRMSPEQKSQLVSALQELDYIVAMVGDGANDCGALKAAHVGVSLSEAEASVAAEFTSGTSNIWCIVHLLCEGRCALVTSFGVFNYMAAYSLIQFVSVLILYEHSSILGNMQFLYIDLVVTTALAVAMGRHGPAARLVQRRPTGSLLAASRVVALALQVVLLAGVQFAALLWLRHQPWYKPNDPSDELVACWENTVVFSVSCFQYLILATVYSKGKPHRQPFYSNVVFLGVLLMLTAFTTLLFVWPLEPLASFFELQPVTPESVLRFRLMLILFPCVHLVLAFLIEFCIADSLWLKHVLHWVLRKRKPKNKYKCILQSMDWSFDLISSV